MRVLVTGSSGFLGSHLVAALRAAGHEVVGADRHAPRPGAPWPHQLQVVDCTDPAQVRPVLAGVAQVYDLAASLGGVGYLAGHQSAMWANNTRASLTVLEAAAAAGARYLFASSTCVYPDRRPPAATGWREDEAWTGPPSEGAYGAAKLMHEQACVAYRDQGADTRIVRLSNTYGPWCDWTGGREKAPAALCRKVAEAVRDGADHITVWGDGQQLRAYLDVRDTVAGLLALMDSDVREPVNLGHPAALSVDGLAGLILRAAGVRLGIAHAPGPTGPQMRTADATRARERLGWAPAVAPADGIARVYAWVREQVAARAEVAV